MRFRASDWRRARAEIVERFALPAKRLIGLGAPGSRRTGRRASLPALWARLLTLGEYQKAISDLTEALGERHDDPFALTRRAQAYEALGRKSEALDDFRAALDANPKLESAREGFDRITTEQQRSDRHK